MRRTVVQTLYLLSNFLFCEIYIAQNLICSAEETSSEYAFFDPALELKIKVYGYPELNEKKFKIENFNPLQAENLSLVTPGLTIAKLGSMGQKTSLRYNSYTTGDLAFLFDGFEISDPSDPSEGFEISSFLLVPNFDLKISSAESTGVFSRQLGGVISIDPLTTDKSYIRSTFGSNNQGLLSVQKNICKSNQCLSLAGGGTYVKAQSASTRPGVQNSGPSNLESDAAGLGYLSLGYQKQLGASRLLKVRVHSQFSKTEIDDYNEFFIYKDDPNALLTSSNHFFGASYITDQHQIFFENSFLNRNLKNDWDINSSTIRNESYNVFRSKIRGSHHLVPFQVKGLDLYWYSQNINLNTDKINNGGPSASENLSLLEAGVQLDKKNIFKKTELITSFSYNDLESYGAGAGITQSVQHHIMSSGSSNMLVQSYFGYKQRRPSLYQLFDPQFGSRDLNSEKLFFLRPKIKAQLKDSLLAKHNISLEYFYENIESRVVYSMDSQPGYRNSGHINSNSFVLDYQLEVSNFSTRFFYRKSLDSEFVLKSLPWSTSEEIGFGSSFQSKVLGGILAFSTDIKWLSGMFNTSQKQIGNLVQSQGNVSFQIDANDRINLQLNNIFNDKKIWDEGFRRQSFSWMFGLTKKI